jgi:hypothetical protein
LSKIAKDGKSENITIRVTPELKARAEGVWREKYQALPFNTFLGQMIHVGIEEEKMWIEIIAERKNKIKNDVLLRAMRKGRDNYKTEGIPPDRFEDEKGGSKAEISEEPPPLIAGMGRYFTEPQKAPGGTTSPQEGPQAAEGDKSIKKGTNPIHDKKRG